MLPSRLPLVGTPCTQPMSAATEQEGAGFGAPGRIRTDDARLRTAALYSTELRGPAGILPRRAGRASQDAPERG